RKFDICSDTIFRAAPGVREVYLYSHGNTAVLRGWAAKDGLAKLLSNENDEKDCDEYKAEFEQRLRENCKNLIPKVEIVPFNEASTSIPPKVSTTVESPAEAPTSSEKSISEDWIRLLDPYKNFMTRINRNLQNQVSVKVAILDDGADVSQFEGSNQQGETFHPEHDWFLGQCSHGTAMARCVRDICPGAELLVYRLDNSGKSDSKQRFTIKSCTEVCFMSVYEYQALQHARKMGADIISMSWSYQRERSSTDTDKEEFEKLVADTLQDKKSILFASHPDVGAIKEISDFAPVSLEGIIRICSATIYGAMSKENLYATADFILPGEGLHMKDIWKDPVRGSSFATAYAAGLAALVLYTLRAHLNCMEDDTDDSGTAKKLLNIVSRHQGMRKVFRILAKEDPENTTAHNCFVRPYFNLEGCDEDDLERQKKHLQTVVNNIVPQRVLSA
ncbi:hypothetical protein ASPZODRAFT_33681, partial [Penicilliopsis zonata CBS 506.65]